jgi:hypothetical protein
MATATASKSTKTKIKTPAKDIAASYNKAKKYNGQQYTGMAVGRSHKWNYDKGIWRETKVTPERWELTYDVIQRRAGHAPEGSGVPVGTAYHWFILSHQYVEKLNADDYTTSMVGLKFKLAHKHANSDKWNASDTSQRNHLISILEDMIAELKKEPEETVPVVINFDYRGKNYSGAGIPVMSYCHDGACFQLAITLNKKHLGVLKNTDKGWHLTDVPQGLANAIGNEVSHWYNK